MLQRRQTHVGNKPLNFSPSNGKCNDQLHDLIECFSRAYKQYSFLILNYSLLSIIIIILI